MKIQVTIVSGVIQKGDLLGILHLKRIKNLLSSVIEQDTFHVVNAVVCPRRESLTLIGRRTLSTVYERKCTWRD